MDNYGLDQESIGPRIARARKLRGLTQRRLAEMTPCSHSLLTKVERGHRTATPALVAAVAAALHVEITELTGQPYRGDNEKSDRIHAAIPQIRHALVYWDIPPELESPPRDLSVLRREVSTVTRLRNEARYVELGETLPRLLLELTAISHDATGNAQKEAFGLLASAYCAVDSMAHKLGYLDLLHLAVERMRWAASSSNDPLLPSVADTRFSMVFLSQGAYSGGLKLLERTVTHLDSLPEDAETESNLSVRGAVHLCAAMLAARGNRPSATYEHLGAARESAGRLGKDTRTYGLSFGPTNTTLHEVAAAVELGDADEAIRRGVSVRFSPNYPAERTSHHFIDMGRAYLWAGKPEQSLDSVLTAERIASQRTRYHPFARETVRALLDQKRQVPEPMRGIAHRMKTFTNL